MTVADGLIAQILKVVKDLPYTEVKLEAGGLELHVLKEGAHCMEGAGSIPVAPGMHTRVAVANEDHSGRAPDEGAPDAGQAAWVAVCAPIAGVFYRAPSPGAKPFVDVGDRVTADDTIGLIEVMKLFNSVPAGRAGRVMKILVENGSVVEEGQRLLVVEPVRSDLNDG